MCVKCQEGNTCSILFLKMQLLKTKQSEILADHIVEWLVERGQDNIFQAIGGDSTNPPMSTQAGVEEQCTGLRSSWKGTWSELSVIFILGNFHSGS